MGTEILHFDQLEGEKNEFEVCKSNLEKLKSEKTEIFMWINKILNSIFWARSWKNYKISVPIT